MKARLLSSGYWFVRLPNSERFAQVPQGELLRREHCFDGDWWTEQEIVEAQNAIDAAKGAAK